MAEGYSFFRDRDGTLCRDNPTGPYEVWWPTAKKWSAYTWDSREVVPITAEEARAQFGDDAVKP